MAQKLLSNPFIEVNEVKIAIYGNTFVYDLGLPDINVQSVSAGGGAVESIHGVDSTTSIGMCKFKMPSTKETSDFLSTWKTGVGTNTIVWYEGDLKLTLAGASFSDGREMEMNSSEGGIEVTFKGDPIATV
jgi:hypothetical protein